jgi:hypothetical protein
MRKGLAVVVAAATCAVWIGYSASHISASPSSPCDLTLKFGGRSQGPSGQFHINLVFVNNTDDAPCRLTGFPEVELIGPVYPIFGSIYELPDQAGRSQAVMLRPGQSAHALLTWLPASSGNRRWVPGYIRVVVPTNRGPSLPMALPWRYGSVLRQDAATHPGTYIGPIR